MTSWVQVCSIIIIIMNVIVINLSMAIIDIIIIIVNIIIITIITVTVWVQVHLWVRRRPCLGTSTGRSSGGATSDILYTYMYHTYVYTYVCIYIYIYTCIYYHYIYLSIQLSIYVSIYLSIHLMGPPRASRGRILTGMRDTHISLGILFILNYYVCVFLSFGFLFLLCSVFIQHTCYLVVRRERRTCAYAWPQGTPQASAP